jgi:hypothetical protein
MIPGEDEEDEVILSDGLTTVQTEDQDFSIREKESPG